MKAQNKSTKGSGRGASSTQRDAKRARTIVSQSPDAPARKSARPAAPARKGKAPTSATIRPGQLDQATLEDADRFLKRHRSLFERLAKL